MTIIVEELQKMGHMDELKRQVSWFKNPAFPSRGGMGKKNLCLRKILRSDLSGK